MPIEIRRFGVGNRRPQGPPGTSGVTGQVIHSDAAGTIAELAFARGGRIEPHANPNQTWFVVIEGGGWVEVGEERARVAAGDAVSWPPDVPHGAWAEYGEMRAIVVELAPPGVPGGALIEGHVVPLLAPSEDPASRAEGELREPERRPSVGYDPEEGEPR
jgi:quercetin dioxygenase-like cupin family protein